MKLVTCPVVLLNVPAAFCMSPTTLAIPKSSSLTVASPRGSPMTKMFRRLHVAVRDAFAVGQGERLCGRLEQLDRVGDRARGEAARLLVPKELYGVRLKNYLVMIKFPLHSCIHPLSLNLRPCSHNINNRIERMICCGIERDCQRRSTCSRKHRILAK